LATYFAEGRGGFAGLFGFCSWFPHADQAASALKEKDIKSCHTALQRLFDPAQKLKDLPTARENYDMNIMLQHSRDDDVIAIDNGVRLRDMLRGLEYNVEWHGYEDGGHWVNEPQGVDDFVAFLRGVMVPIEDEPRYMYGIVD
jgi:lysophospholipase II